MKKRVADLIMEILCEKGITDCFSVVGGGAMHLNNALALCEGIHKYFNHHEQASAMAAEAYARMSGRLAMVCVTSGPGGTNTLTGVMGAWQDSLPMLVLSGQVRYETTIEAAGIPLRYRGVQEFDIINSIGNMTKYAMTIKDPLEIKRELYKAIGIAMSGRRGPVWIDVPLDIQSAWVEEESLYPAKTYLVDNIEPKIQEIEELMQLLQEAKRPCILVGNGVRNSHNIEKFRKWVQELGVPVVGAAIAADAMYSDYENFYGMSGSIGPRTGNFIVQNADIIVSVGCSLGYKMTGFAQEKFAPNAYIVAIDIDENEMKKPGIRVNKLIHANLENFLDKALQKATKIQVPDEWRVYCNKLKLRFSAFEPGENVDLDERVCAYYFWKIYEKYEPSNNISILGNNTANSAKLQIGIKQPDQRLIANNNCGSMGADLPEAIGTTIASGQEVVCITGDGSIMMNLQELQTIVHYKLPVKIIIFSNEGYAAIRQTCKNFFKETYIGCTPESGVSFPKFEKLAQAFGYPYRLCQNNRQIGEALQWLFDQSGFAILEVEQRLDDPISPKVMSRLNPDGTFATPALHDMAPFLEEDELKQLMF